MNIENDCEKDETKALSQIAVSDSTCFGKDALMLVEHINNDSNEKEYGDVIGETQGYFIVKPHLRKEQNRWLKVDCKVLEYYH
jgi:hypothetical protein